MFQYLQHDKRAEGQSRCDTDERVEWQSFRNLATDNADMAWRIMMATANQQDALKQASGGSVAGNKSDKVVFHYSLGWHPDEAAGLTKAEMLRAADESLRALGAGNHQAAIIAHNDTKHPHVHVVINRVNTENGKMLDIWNYQKKLSKWAMAYEQERGKVLCDKRVENWKRRDLGEAFSVKDTPHHKATQSTGHAANDNDRDLAKLLAEQKAKDAALAAFGAKMHAKHANQWTAYRRDFKDSKAHIFARDPDAPTPFQQASMDVAARFKPLRSELGRKQWRETKAFEKNEKAILGKLENVIAAIKISKALSNEKLGGAQSNLFNFLTSSKHRKAALEKYHKLEWRDIGSAQRQQTDLAKEKVVQDRKATEAAHRAKYANKRQLLTDSQDAEKAALTRKWQQRHEDRASVLAVIDRMATLKQAKPASQAKAHSKTHEGVKAAPESAERKAFVKATGQKRKRKGRVRKRERE